MIRIGFGNDVHRLIAGKPLVIGGIRVESDLGADGHSDADVLLHAVTDAILGSLALGDIGTHFPNTDPQWKDADSTVFLARAVELAAARSFVVSNVDSTISLEAPRLKPYIEQIRSNLARILEVDAAYVSVKAKTGEGLDAVGKREAITAVAVVLLQSDGR